MSRALRVCVCVCVCVCGTQVIDFVREKGTSSWKERIDPMSIEKGHGAVLGSITSLSIDKLLLKYRVSQGEGLCNTKNPAVSAASRTASSSSRTATASSGLGPASASTRSASIFSRSSHRGVTVPVRVLTYRPQC